MSETQQNTNFEHPRAELPTDTRSRYLFSRLFAIFAFCATFFGLAMLVVFLLGLAQDVYQWTQTTPALVEERNEEVRAQQRKLADAEKAVKDRRDEKEKEMREELAEFPEGEEKEAIRKEYREAIERDISEYRDLTLGELKKAAKHDLREDTSLGRLLVDFVTNPPAPDNEPQNTGIRTAILGSLYVVLIAILSAVPIGVGAAIFLEEYRADTWLARLIQVNINNLAGVPSIMFGILGATLFVEWVFKPIENEISRGPRLELLRTKLEKHPDLEPGKDERDRVRALIALEAKNSYEQKVAELKELEKRKAKLEEIEKIRAEIAASKESLESGLGVKRRMESLYEEPIFPLGPIAHSLDTMGVSVSGRNILGAGFTLGLLVLPVIIVSSQEAIRAVPQSLRHGSLALGATRWQTVWKIVLPSAFPGILTGSILSMCRAIGEAAPLVAFGALLYVNQNPTPFSKFSAMPLQIYSWADRSDIQWKYNAALAAAILVGFLLLLNGVAIYFRNRSQRNL